MSKTVYVLETGCYADRGIAGVYSQPEIAMRAHKGTWRREESEHEGHKFVSWSNDLGWDDAGVITPFVIDE